LFAEEAGLSLDLNVLPPGTFNYYDNNQYTPAEALDILNGYLLPKGYCLLRRDDFLVCVNIDDPIPPSLIPNVSPNDLEQRGKNELMTVIFPLEGVDVTQIATEVNEIKGPQGKVVGLKSTNSLLVSDIGSNLLRIREMLAGVTARGGPNDITFKAYQVKHIDVIDAEQIVRTLLGVAPRVSNVSAETEARNRMMMRGGGDSRDRRSQQPSPQPSSQQEKSPVRVATDMRTNQLLVTATLAQHLLVEQTLKTIDIDGDASQFVPSSNRPFLKVYQVTSSDPREVTKTIDSLMPGIVVNEDARNRKIHIQATPDQHRQVETLIAQMDGMGGDRQMAVIPLSRLDPVSVATTLRSMFAKDGEAAPIIEPDYYGQQLMIRASTDQIAQIRTLLNQLGEDGQGRRGRADNSMARTVPLAGRDPAELLPLIQKMWNANNETPIRIVTPPGAGNSTRDRDRARDRDTPPVRDSAPSIGPPQTQVIPSRKDDSTPAPALQKRGIPLSLVTQTRQVAQAPQVTQAAERSPNGPADSQTETHQAPANQAPVNQAQHPLLSGTADVPANSSSASTPSTGSAATTPSPTPPNGPQSQSDIDQMLDDYLDGKTGNRRGSSPSQRNATPNSSSKSELNIVVMGDELFITSSDPEQLNQFEELLAQTMQAIPPRVTWTVFTLRVADATEAANMLKLFFPGSSVSAASSSTGSMMDSLSSGVTSLGSSLRDLTGLGTSGVSQTLRIIPDNRQNALFVSGPAALVREVEEMLKVLDATDLGGDSLRDKIARLIPVQYASVDEVFTIVKDTYKNYIDPPRVQENNNPFAMLAGGQRGGRGNDQGPVTAPKLTVGVDKSTSHLVVWADDALFQEVKTLVESIDQAAQEARRTVRVINLENTNSVVVQGALGSLMPQVKVSVTGSRQTSSPASSTTSNPSSSGNDNADQMRQIFEQRMRERMQGGGGSGRGFGGDRGSFGGGRGGFGGGRGGFGGGGRGGRGG